jgi:hypothetical protein
MAVAQGYGQIVKDSLVLSIDTKDMLNSYKGKPGTNILGTPVQWGGNANLINYANGQSFFTQVGQEQAFIPQLGERTVQFVLIRNDYNCCGCDGYCYCCPSLWRYGDWGVPIEPSTTYTYSIIYKTQSGYTHPNFMYHYQYGPSGYVTEYGVHTEAQRTHLGDGWYFAWNYLTTASNTSSFYPGMWYYQYGVSDKVSLAAVNFVKGTEIQDPRQMFLPLATRSATESLLDLTGNSSSVTVVNTPFGNNMQLEFDGTNSHVVIENPQVYASNTRSFEIIFRSYGGSMMPLAVMTNASSITFYERFWLGVENNRAQWHGWGSSDPQGSKVVTDGNWHHVVFTYNNNDKQMKIYTDGVLEANISNTIEGANISASSTQRWYLGHDPISQQWYGGAPSQFNGEMAVFKQYNKILSDAEVLQNFNHYKSRYNIS